MRNVSIIAIIIFIFSVLCYQTFLEAKLVFQSDQLFSRAEQASSKHRLILITRDLETPFWDKLESGAKEEAEKLGASIEVWGSYGNNQEEFLKKLEIAIYSKVDGIIVQGLDTDEFKKMIKVKAAMYGVPIITVANDVSKADSLRKTYVGSDHYSAGRILARKLLSDMGTEGKVVLMFDETREFYQEQRLSGMLDVFDKYPEINITYAESAIDSDHVRATTQHVLNRVPDANAFITVNGNLTLPMVTEIERRYQIGRFYIYSFEDGPESLALLKQEKIDGIIIQSPEVMGRQSVKLMIKWLQANERPLDLDGYFTPIQIVKAADVQ